MISACLWVPSVKANSKGVREDKGRGDHDFELEAAGFGSSSSSSRSFADGTAADVAAPAATVAPLWLVATSLSVHQSNIMS